VQLLPIIARITYSVNTWNEKTFFFTWHRIACRSFCHIDSRRARCSNHGQSWKRAEVRRWMSIEECTMCLAKCDRFYLESFMYLCWPTLPKLLDFPWNSTVCKCSGCVENLWLIETASHWSEVLWFHIVTTTGSFLILCSLYPSTTVALTKVVLLCALLHLCGMVRPNITDTAISIKSFHPPQAPMIASCALPTRSSPTPLDHTQRVYAQTL